MKLNKRFLSLFLAAVMVMCLIPTMTMPSHAAATRTVYFKNTAAWSVVNIYYWSSSDTGMVSWPGVAMTNVEGDVYGYDIPETATYVIFNNGSVQTQDLALPSQENLYNYETDTWAAYGCIHNWGEGSVTKAATCTQEGEMTYTCSLCSETKTGVIETIAHSFVAGTCSVCGAAEPNDYVLYFDNTDNWDKVYIYYWSDSNSEMMTWPGVSMTFVEDKLYTATVPEEAQYVIFNNTSGVQTEDMPIPESDNLYTYGTGWAKYDTCKHSWGTGSVVTEATCTTDGSRVYTCALCGETKDEVIAASGHSFVNGICTICGKPENCEHTWDEGVVTTEPGCFTFGSKTQTCTACGETQTSSIMPSHDRYVAEVIPATCTATGKEITKCTRCAYSYSKTLPRADHNLVAGEKVAVSCTEDGYTIYTCADCGIQKNQDFVYFTGHTWTGNSCSTCGLVCNHTYVDGICSNCHAGGPNRVDGYYEIATPAHLYWFAAQVNSGNNAINGKLIANIDLKGGEWTSIGYYCSDTLEPDTLAYTGIFDGQGHTVSNFTTIGTDNEGLFGYCSSATIQNVGVINANVTGWRAGAVAGYALTSNVLNCFAINCTITGYTTNSVALNSGTVYIAPVSGPQGGICANSYAVNCKLVDGTDLDVYTAPVGGTDCQNGYYYNVTAPETFSSVRNSTEVTLEQLASGEVTYLLNKGVTDGSQAWYQTCGEGMPAHSGLTVYRTTSCGATDYSYTNNPDAAGGHNYTAEITTPATCTKPGVKTFTCEGCGTSYTQEIPSQGHSYNNGTCVNCGNIDPEYAAPTLSLKYPAVSFEDVIVMNVFFSADNLDNVVEMGLITYGSGVDEWNVENAEYVIPGYTWSEDDGLYYASTQGIAPHYLANTYWFSVYAKLANGAYIYSNLESYSPVTYAKNVLNNSAMALEMRTLAAAMLNYGAAAQTYFNINADNLMNSSMTDEQKKLVAAYSDTMVQDPGTVDENKVGIFANNGGFTKRYPNITLEGAFSINYFFTPACEPAGDVTLYYWEEEDYAAVQTLTVRNATDALVMSGTDALTAAVEGIVAKDLDSTIYVAAVYKDVDGNLCASGVLPYSIGAYCKAQASDATGSMQELAKATAVYAYYAKQLFS